MYDDVYEITRRTLLNESPKKSKPVDFEYFNRIDRQRAVNNRDKVLRDVSRVLLSLHADLGFNPTPGSVEDCVMCFLNDHVQATDKLASDVAPPPDWNATAFLFGSAHSEQASESENDDSGDNDDDDDADGVSCDAFFDTGICRSV